jgi:DNA mismatch repair protein MutL
LSTPSSIFTPAYQSPLSFDFNKPVFNDVSNTAQEHATGETTVQQQTVSISEQRETIKTYQLIGQYKKTYLLLEQEDGLFLIDQHAAHERILYELFEHRFQEVATVALLFPHIVTLCEEDAQLMTPYLDLFNKNGILIELFGNNQFIVQSVPVHLKDCSYDDLIKEVVGWIKQERDVDHADLFKMLHEKMRAQMACKAAVKAGDELTWQQMETLLDDLSKTNNRFTCPHGRPTGWLLSLHDIEKKFKRKV